MQKSLIGGVVALAMVGAFARPHAQAPTVDLEHPTFDSASIKPNKGGEPRVGLRGQPGGLLNAFNMTPLGLIQYAYRVQGFQVSGGPDWIRNDRFDVNAKAGANVPPAQTQLMMQALLAERFRLVVHKDSKDAPIYALVMAKNGGKPGAQLKTSECPPPTPGRQGGPPQANGQTPCGSLRIGPGVLTAQGIPIAQLLTFLSNSVNRTVIDRTGLTGTFDVEMKWMPDPALGGGGPFGGLPPGPPGAAPQPPASSDVPDLFTAIQEQLGLKLDSQRGPVELLVIDRIEQPTAD